MHTPLRVLIAVLFLSVSFAGCLGGDEAPAPSDAGDGAEEPTVTEETGAVKGQIVTKDLEEVANAAVALVDDQGAIAADTKTDKQGRFTFNDVTPGTYKVQVSALCCKAAMANAEVTANTVTEVNFQLEKLSLSDLKVPTTVSEEWQGFMSCGVGTAAVAWATCATLEDPNMDFLHEFTVGEGLKTIIVGVTWEPIGGAMGTDLSVNVEDEGCGVLCEGDRIYGEADGPPQILLRIDQGPSTALSFDNITGERTIQIRVFPSGEANVMYQQPFTVYWHAFYWEEAPADFNPFPDA